MNEWCLRAEASVLDVRETEDAVLNALCQRVKRSRAQLADVTSLLCISIYNVKNKKLS